MTVFESIRTLRAIRAYTPEPVPDELVRQILEAGRLTGSSMNQQPWHFVVVREPATLAQLGALSPYGPYIAQASLAIVVAIDKSRFGVSDASRAIQSMVLTAWEAGVGSNWVGFGGMTEVAELLGIPESVDVLAILPLGYPADPPRGGKKNRKPLGEVAHAERWGEPFQ